MFYLLGLAIFLFSVGSTIFILGGDLLYFLNLPTWLIIFVPLVGILTATQSFKVFGAGIKAVILPQQAISEDLRGKAASLFRFLSKVTALTSGIMVLICFVNILMNIDFSYPDAIYGLGINIAASLISLVYAFVLIAAVFEPIVFILKKRQNQK